MLSRAQAIANATQAIEELKSEYPDRLRDSFRELSSMARDQRWSEFGTPVYDIYCEAATLGWPFVGDAAGVLLNLLKLPEREQSLKGIHLCLEAMTLLLDHELKGPCPESTKLIKDLRKLEDKLVNEEVCD